MGYEDDIMEKLYKQKNHVQELIAIGGTKAPAENKRALKQDELRAGLVKTAQGLDRPLTAEEKRQQMILVNKVFSAAELEAKRQEVNDLENKFDERKQVVDKLKHDELLKNIADKATDIKNQVTSSASGTEKVVRDVGDKTTADMKHAMYQLVAGTLERPLNMSEEEWVEFLKAGKKMTAELAKKATRAVAEKENARLEREHEQRLALADPGKLQQHVQMLVERAKLAEKKKVTAKLEKAMDQAAKKKDKSKKEEDVAAWLKAVSEHRQSQEQTTRMERTQNLKENVMTAQEEHFRTGRLKDEVTATTLQIELNSIYLNELPKGDPKRDQHIGRDNELKQLLEAATKMLDEEIKKEEAQKKQDRETAEKREALRKELEAKQQELDDIASQLPEDLDAPKQKGKKRGGADKEGKAAKRARRL